MFISRKLKEDRKIREVKPAIVKHQCLAYKFQCNLCDEGYVVYTRSHLHERVDGHRQKSSWICKHFSQHKSNVPPCFLEQFLVLTKCSNKFDCLINEMLFIRKLKPSLNVQTDLIRAKVLTWGTCAQSDPVPFPLVSCDNRFFCWLCFAARQGLEFNRCVVWQTEGWAFYWLLVEFFDIGQNEV